MTAHETAALVWLAGWRSWRGFNDAAPVTMDTRPKLALEPPERRYQS